MGCRAAMIIAVLFAPLAMAQNADRIKSESNAVTTIGQRNPALYEGAQALLAGHDEEGIRLTLQGLEMAQGRREEEAALSNLCAGYIRLKQYDTALMYCEMLLARNENSWRGYNNRAVIYIQTRQYEKADQDLTRGEQLNPGAHTLKVARALYMDAVHPVTPEVEIDDRQGARKADGDEKL